MMATATRPAIETIKTSVELKRWYWMKDELVAHAKVLGVPYSCGKFELLDRIATFLETGVKPKARRQSAASKFDWHSETLTRDTVITDSYKNSQNVRRFFKAEACEDFKFNIEFMAWMKANVGKTLGDAVDEYQAIRARMANPDFQSKIAAHNQFNQYTRDFLADNPDLGIADVRKFWALKRAMQSSDGRHDYERSDLKLM